MSSSELFLPLYPQGGFENGQTMYRQDILPAYFFLPDFWRLHQKIGIEILIALCYDEGDRKDLKN